MAKFSRRNFLKAGAVGGALAAAGCHSTGSSKGGSKHVVVIGGGFGGATAAKYLKRFDPSINVTMIEVSSQYVTCPGSNWVLGGLTQIDKITQSFDALKKQGINVVQDWVTDVDTGSQVVMTKSGKKIGYDRLIVSPGIDFKFDSIKGYNEALSETRIPHAYKAGPQTLNLRKQLENMKDGGTFAIVPPPNPFRCPPGPGERISMIAHYFKQHKPNSKIVALDMKGKFSKAGLFKKGWAKLYPGMIDYRSNTKVVELKGNTLITTSENEMKGFDTAEVHADVINIIPPQKAGMIAHKIGLADKSGWCPVDHVTWESKQVKNVHVIGDAAIQSPLPKSGYAANSEAKACVAAIAALMNGQKPGTPSWVNTCYSLVGPEYGISVAMVYDIKNGKVSKVKGSGGLTPKGTNNALEALYTQNWYDNVTNDSWG